MGNYNGFNIYLYSSPKYNVPRLFHSSEYYCLPKWIQDPDKLSFRDAIRIIKMRHSDNFKPENIDIDKVIESVKNQK
jgi:hypothetical protein